MARKAVSIKTQNNVLIKSRRRCALCFGLENDRSVKNGQIAHIDRNNKNNNEDNLAYLCLECHNIYDSQFRQTKSYTPHELSNYKALLEEWVKENFPSFNPRLSENDIKLYNEIKKYFMDSGVLNKIKKFNFGMTHHIDYFMISDGLFGSDLINIYDEDVPPITFQNKELKQEFEIFKYWYCEFEALISNTYQSDPNNFMFYNPSYYNCPQKQQEHVKIFKEACENIIASFLNIKYLIEK